MHPVVPASVAKMHAKAAQLAEELESERPLQQKHGSSFKDSPATSAAAAVAAGLRVQGSIAPAATRRTSQIISATKPASAADGSQAAALQWHRFEAQVHHWKGKYSDAEKELERCQESYMRREEQLKARLEELEHFQEEQQQQHQPGSSSPRGAAGKRQPKPPTLQEMQQQVTQGLTDLLQHQRLQLRAEEAQQLRQFRSRLAEVEAQLQADKEAAAADNDSWTSKTAALHRELVRTQEIAVKLDTMCKLAEEEAVKLRVQFKAQEDDRQHLIKQLLAARRDNKRLKQRAASLQEELDAIMAVELDSTVDSTGAAADQNVAAAGVHSPSRGSSASGHKSRPMTAGVLQGRQQHEQAAGARRRPWSGLPTQQQSYSRSMSLPDSVRAPAANGGCGGLDDVRHEQQKRQEQQQHCSHVIQQLQKLLDSERRQSRQLRANYTAELGRRNELQTLLLDSLQDAKQQYKQAQVAYTAQHSTAAPDVAQREARQLSTSSSSRPPSSSRPQHGLCRRPASALPGGSNRQQLYAIGPTPAGQAIIAAASGGEVLGQEGWGKLLAELLSREQLLEMLVEKACPDLLLAAQQLHEVTAATASSQPQQLQQAWQQQQQTEIQPGHQALVQQSLSLQQPLVGSDGVQLGCGHGVCDGDLSADAYGLETISDCASSDESVEQLFEQEASVEDWHVSQQQQQQQHQQQEGQPPVPQSPSSQSEQLPPPLQQQHRHQQQQQQSQQQEPSADQGDISSPAASSDMPPGCTAVTAATAVTLGAMSGPVMASFPARKQLHLSIGPTRRRMDNNLPMAARRRPESAGAGFCVASDMTVGPSMVRPASAMPSTKAAHPRQDRTVSSSGQAGALQQQPVQQSEDGPAQPQQMQQMAACVQQASMPALTATSNGAGRGQWAVTQQGREEGFRRSSAGSQHRGDSMTGMLKSFMMQQVPTE